MSQDQLQKLEKVLGLEQKGGTNNLLHWPFLRVILRRTISGGGEGGAGNYSFGGGGITRGNRRRENGGKTGSYHFMGVL